MRKRRPKTVSKVFLSRIYVEQIWSRAYLCKEKNYVFVDLRKFYVRKKKLCPQMSNTQITKRIGSANRHICGSSANLTARFVLSEILCTAEKPADTQNSLPGQLANWSERLTTIKENVSSNPLHGYWTYTQRSDNTEYLPMGYTYIGYSDVIISRLTCSTLSLWLRLYNSRTLARHWETHLLGRLTCPTPRETILL
jgi:hypothetical protein